jgi:hypothetical protein
VSAPKIVKLASNKCLYNPKTHSVTGSGQVNWVPADGGGALGTVTVRWTGNKKYAVSATTPQMFDGTWAVTATATKPVTACSVSGQFIPPTASSVLAFIQAKGLPITGITTYDENTDPNHLLGRPNGYLSKVAWQDTRVDQTDQPDDPGGVEYGGSIEVFANSTKALARANYIGAISQASPALGDGYDYLKGPILIRVSGTLNPDDAGLYMKAIPGATEFQYSGSAGAPTTTTTTTTP